MSKVYKVSDDGQLIEHLTAEAVKSIAREQLSNAPRNSEITLEEAKSLIAASEADDCQHICFSFDEARSFAKALREMRAARDAEQDEPAAPKDLTEAERFAHLFERIARDERNFADETLAALVAREARKAAVSVRKTCQQSYDSTQRCTYADGSVLYIDNPQQCTYPLHVRTE